MDVKDKIYWHDAHYEALQLEFHDYRDFLEFDDEFHLSKEALRMDTLIIKKNKDVQIDKNIGKIFRNHNIVEYKSEQDNFGIWDYERVLGYAHIYSSFEEVPISDITVSISLTIYPRDLIKNLENERGYAVQNCGNGIYYVTGAIVPIQILESKKLSENENLFLRNLRSNLSSEDMFKTLQSYRERRVLSDKNIFLSRLAKANPKAYLEAINMFSEDLRELFMEGVEQYGWLDNRDNAKVLEERKRLAQKLLARGDLPDEVAEIAELPISAVIEIANQL